MGAFLVAFLSLAFFLTARAVLSQVIIALHDAVPGFSWEAVERVLAAQGVSDDGMLLWFIVTIDGLMLVCALLLAVLLARGLTRPVESLADAVRGMRPSRWLFQSAVGTGDEIEELESRIGDMALRLRHSYGALEGLVKERTAELQRQYALDRAILQNVDYGVVMVDAEGVIQMMNPAAIRLMGHRRSDMMGHPVAAALTLCEGRDCLPLANHPVERCLRSGRSFRSGAGDHLSIARSNGEKLPIVLLVSPLTEGRKKIGAVAVFQDVSEERRIDEMKSEFITLASHQLRTPMSIVRWYVDLLRDNKTLDDEQRGYLAEMGTAVDRMVRLLNALLQVARLEGGEIAMDGKDVDLRAAVREIADENSALAKRRGMTVSALLPRGAIRLWTDGALLKVVLQNLIGNAIKYGRDKGAVRIAVKVLPKVVRVTVQDNGIGIPRGEQPKIFQKFFRAQNIKHIDTDGNGLGLYMCKMIIDGLGGRIGFTSAEGKGTTFTIELPKRKHR